MAKSTIPPRFGEQRLFALPYRNTSRNRVAQGLLAPACRTLVLLDPVVRGRIRYAVGMLLTSAVR
jgi:hypothetical protein